MTTHRDAPRTQDGFQAPLIRSVDESEARAYDRKGWVYLPGLVNPGYIAVLRSKAKTAAWALTSPPQAGGRSASSRKQLAAAFAIGARPSHDDPDFAQIALSPALGDNASRLLPGHPAVRLEIDNLLVKEPADRSSVHGGTRWHQDFPYSPMDRTFYVTFWIALADIPAEMGSLRFVTASYRLGLLGRSWLHDDDDLLVQHPWLADYEQSPPLDLKAGDATAHSCLTVHGAPANRSRMTRLSYVCSYFDAATLFTGAPYTGTSNLGLAVNQPFDHDAFPVVGSGLNAS